ncbi:MAG: hypothetical protein Q7S69_01490 [Nitrosomonadaceae bacterium]|nr:hypothetical protein [Nitrosomonadaceae bacterium]
MIKSVRTKTIKRWKNGSTALPESASRLLRFHVLGDVSALLGQSREGFYFRDGLLFIGEWRRGMEPTEIRTLFWQVQQVAGLQREIRQLKQELERRSEEIDALEVKADFYRRQVALESRFGMMLERTFA